MPLSTKEAILAKLKNEAIERDIKKNLDPSLVLQTPSKKTVDPAKEAGPQTLNFP